LKSIPDVNTLKYFEASTFGMAPTGLKCDRVCLLLRLTNGECLIASDLLVASGLNIASGLHIFIAALVILKRKPPTTIIIR
jgi:hypothetical protein